MWRLVIQDKVCVLETEHSANNPSVVRAPVKLSDIFFSIFDSRRTLVQAFAASQWEERKKHKDACLATLICSGWHSRFVNTRMKTKIYNNILEKKKNGAKTLRAKWVMTCFNESALVSKPTDSVSCIQNQHRKQQIKKKAFVCRQSWNRQF